MSDKLNDLCTELVISTRDSRRPSMELVISTITELFEKMPDLEIRPLLQGPDLWSWIDPGIGPGHEKFYSIGRSNLNGAEGYPLLTIRQTIAPNLDSYSTFSCLIVGSTREEIMGAINSAFVYHVGSYGGLRSTMMRYVNTGDIVSTLAHALSIGSDREVTASEILESEVAQRLGVSPPAKGDLN